MLNKIKEAMENGNVRSVSTLLATAQLDGSITIEQAGFIKEWIASNTATVKIGNDEWITLGNVIKNDKGRFMVCNYENLKEIIEAMEAADVETICFGERESRSPKIDTYFSTKLSNIGKKRSGGKK